MDITAINLIGKNNKLLYKILANNFKPKDLRDVIELNNEYVEIAKNRLEGDSPLFSKVEVK